MVTAEKTIEVTSGSEVDRLLDEVDKAPLTLTRDGVRYLLRVDDPGAYYDPAKAIAGMRAAAGRFPLSEAEADEMIENIYRWREEGSRPWRPTDERPLDRP